MSSHKHKNQLPRNGPNGFHNVIDCPSSAVPNLGNAYHQAYMNNLKGYAFYHQLKIYIKICYETAIKCLLTNQFGVREFYFSVWGYASRKRLRTIAQHQLHSDIAVITSKFSKWQFQQNFDSHIKTSHYQFHQHFTSNSLSASFLLPKKYKPKS